MSMENKTAVEWLVEQLIGTGCLTQKPESSSVNGLKVLKVFNQAKAMEKEQIIEAHDEARTYVLKNVWKHDDGERYYKETYEVK
jgi:hypothetical protein